LTAIISLLQLNQLAVESVRTTLMTLFRANVNGWMAQHPNTTVLIVVEGDIADDGSGGVVYATEAGVPYRHANVESASFFSGCRRNI